MEITNEYADSQNGKSVNGYAAKTGTLVILCMFALATLIVCGRQIALDHINTDLTLAVQQIDSMLGDAEQAAELPASSSPPCSTLALTLREIVARHSTIRSLTVAKGQTLTCSSIYGHRGDPVDFSGYAEGRLTLLGGNVLTPGHALIVLRSSFFNFSVLAGIDGTKIRNTLEIAPGLRFVVGSAWLDQDGIVHCAHDDGTHAISVASSRFPYAVAIIPTYKNIMVSMARTIMSPRWMIFLLCVVFTVFLAGVVARRWPEVRLWRAVTKGEFVAYMQPVMDANGANIVGSEVLMRWLHPVLGVIRPDHFIPLAESTGLIVPMTRSLMLQVQRCFEQESVKLPVGFHFAFNITASHCRDLSLVHDCSAFLASFANQSIKLVLELTERELLVPDEMTLKLFAELKELGVLIAIDDFGTGHSSLSYLQTFEIDTLKIDRSFVALIDRDPLSTHIVDNVLDLAKRLDLEVVAEGIEDGEQRDSLKDRGVEHFQGYFFGKPVPITDFLQNIVPCGDEFVYVKELSWEDVKK
ncbi:TPA: cyclic diguanylate phosphodiesterase [Aeromonas veronii]|nr:cyclic diguanylate phosphodiesterase [Aeromonas veronii]